MKKKDQKQNKKDKERSILLLVLKWLFIAVVSALLIFGLIARAIHYFSFHLN